MRILIVQDDSGVGQAFERALQREGHDAFWIDLGAEALELTRHNDYDAILLDDFLPDLSWATALEKLRAAGVRAPVIVHGTLFASPSERARALEAGADYALSLPTALGELLAVLTAAHRRYRGAYSRPDEESGKPIDLSAHLRF